MATDRDAVAAAVRVEMARQRATGVQIAAATGMNQKALSRRLRGEVAFSVDELISVARALGVNVAELLPEVAA